MSAERTRESHVAIPFQQSLISGLAFAMAVGAAGLLFRRWGGFGYGWVEVAMLVVASFALGFAAVWGVLLWALRPERPQPEPRPMPQLPEPARMDLLMPTTPLVFDARDGREFVNAALIRVNGAWVDKDGGCSWRAMERKGYSRERWEQGVAWLQTAGLLRWKDENEHRLGLCWDFARVQQFVGL